MRKKMKEKKIKEKEKIKGKIKKKEKKMKEEKSKRGKRGHFWKNKKWTVRVRDERKREKERKIEKLE